MQPLPSRKRELINKLILMKTSSLLWLSVAFSLIFTQIIVMPMSIFFYGKVTHEFIITGVVCAFLVSLIVCYFLIQLINLVREREGVLRDSEDKFKSLFNSISDAIFIIDLQGHILEANDIACERLGYKKEELLRMMPMDFDTPECAALVRQRINQTQQKSEVIFETTHVRRDGTLIPTEINAQIVAYEGKQALLGICRDITERKRAEDQMKQSLLEKETLLQEVHHRVKNNLAIISSLLALQSKQIKDKTLKAMFEDSQQRITAMALVHEKLYRTANFSQIDFGDYINTIVKELLSTFNVEGKDITTGMDIADIKLDLEYAIPCGLMINELLTNSFKYAFPGDRGGEIAISFTKRDDTYTLTIKDNGIGLPEGFEYKQANTLGLQLVNVLAKQVRGTLQMNSEGGTKAIITFRARGDKDE